ncbi:hypothetical protein [Streptomyces sp. NPDC047097]|uniref:hypothetical protein n=1 Tax=Streptomyces sp. NPDC047097 TaxID=3155260 RepID=UPI0033F0C88E
MPERTRHGSYWLSRVTPDAYEAISREWSVRLLREWVDQFGEVPAALEVQLRCRAFDGLVSADRVYHLSGLGDEDVPDWGRVHDCFHEFVLIDRSAGRITLLIAADD